MHFVINQLILVHDYFPVLLNINRSYPKLISSLSYIKMIK